MSCIVQWTPYSIVHSDGLVIELSRIPNIDRTPSIELSAAGVAATHSACKLRFSETASDVSSVAESSRPDRVTTSAGGPSDAGAGVLEFSVQAEQERLTDCDLFHKTL